MALAGNYLVLILLIVAVILDVIVVAIPYWFNVEKVHAGLWRACNKDTCVEYPVVTTYITVSRALHMCGLLAGIIALALFIILELTEKASLKMRRIMYTILSLVAGAFILIADCYMSKNSLLYAGCLAPSLLAAFLFIFVGGRSSTISAE